MAEETWMPTEIIILAMFKNKHSTRFKQIALKHQIRNTLEFLQCVWRICENHIIGSRATTNITEHIITHNTPGIITKRNCSLFKMRSMHCVHFYRCDTLATTRQELKADTTCSGKEIKHCHLFKIQHIIKDIEKVFLGKIRCWTRLKITWHIKMTAFIFPTNYSHSINACKSKGIPSILFNNVDGKSAFALRRLYLLIK